MGYWEQTGEENRRYRERRAGMSPRLRALRDFAETAVVAALSAALWAALIWSIVGPFF